MRARSLCHTCMTFRISASTSGLVALTALVRDNVGYCDHTSSTNVFFVS